MRTTKLRTAAAVTAVAAAVAFASIVGAADEHGHDHDATPATTKPAPDDHAGHDHGHDHDKAPATTKPAADDHAGHDHDHDKVPATAKPAATDAHKGHGDDKGHDGHGHHDDHAGHGDGHDDHGAEVRLTPGAVRQAGIRVGKAEKRSLRASVVAPARVAFDADAMAHVGSAVQGRVVELPARVGDLVKNGDVLAVVESAELGRAQGAYLQRQTEAEVAAAAVGPAREAYERAKRLMDESQGVSLAEVQRRESEHRAAAGARATTEAAMRAAGSELGLLGLTPDDVARLVASREVQSRYAVRAPIGGRVVGRGVTLGELVGPDRDKLMVVADTSACWVWADVPEARLGDVAVGNKAEVDVPALAGPPIAGEVSLVSAEVDPGARSARARVVVANADGRLKPGMFARVTLFAAGGEATVTVPAEAVQTVEGKPTVFVPVAGEADTFAPRAVVVGRAVSGYVPVESGLDDGDAVVVSGTYVLKAELGKSEATHDH